LPSASLLAPERLRAGLEACGYHCAVALLPGSYPVFPGCSVALQFGDRIAVGADGTTRLTVGCSIQINDGREHVSGVSFWQIRKLFHSTVDPDRLCFVIEADVILHDPAEFAEVLAHGGDLYRHLQMLIADACDTLRDLPIEGSHGQEADGPIVRIEAQFLGDLAAGRSGLVASSEPANVADERGATTRRLSMTRAACAALGDDILPDLARAVGDMIAPARSSMRSPVQASAAMGQGSHACSPGSWSHEPAVAAACDVITAIVHEPVQ
jgi:hypothetical protein